MQTQGGNLGIRFEENVDIPMRDGVLLRGNLWRPDTAGAFPGLILRTPYGKARGGYERFVRAGYAVLSQDTRGRYASEGEFTVFSHPSRDAEDGYDTVEWMAAQPWCNGRVGTMGVSYVGWTQWMTARTRPPHLQAMCARSIPLELADVDWCGAFRPGRRLRWWFTTIAPDLRRRAGWPPPHTPAEAREIWDNLEQGRWLGLLPYADVADFLPPPLAGHVRDWFQHPWRRCWHFAEAHADIDIPNLDFTGWYDHCNSLGHFQGMRRHARTEAARRHTKVVIGPWGHCTAGRRECFGIDFGPQAAVDIQDMEIRWFDHWLKGVNNGIVEAPAVRYFVLGSGTWKEASTWPPPEAAPVELYLDGDDTAARPGTGGTLTSALPASPGVDAYRYDPRDPVPTLWDRQLMAGATDRSRLDYRRDILRYRTPFLEADIEIAGHPECVLFVSTSAPDTDFFVWLADEYPDGRAIEVCHGMVRLRHRHGLECDDPVPPGELVELTLRLGPTACCFRAGHRLRLEVTSSDFPNVDRNHNTGRNDLFDTELRVAYQRLRRGPETPSRIILPLTSAPVFPTPSPDSKAHNR